MAACRRRRSRDLLSVAPSLLQLTSAAPPGVKKQFLGGREINSSPRSNSHVFALHLGAYIRNDGLSDSTYLAFGIQEQIILCASEEETLMVFVRRVPSLSDALYIYIYIYI